ncbi:hypothetical protein L5515_015078 [Caenorhabditis briggsae]|uniref:ACB domain-containing protein n=3 Tax=Caenorhabditis TaxID=6237 RepID=A0AAE9EDV3_CAEBR|nr:hypothetical protein B9Z55_006788 [Caenorhabditis nigoni]ULU07598.1 hypothetical protein L3Y34_018953 [Caenorhabditis briggsae]UMM19511.1 hypothetical protein L5515_015078 [Caenorhabditis briggsae]
MPISELEKKWTGLTFEIAAEEMRRLKSTPSEREQMKLYGLYKQALHGDIPNEDVYPVPAGNELGMKKYAAWKAQKGLNSEKCRSEYVTIAEEMIKKYGRNIVRCKWNSEVWSVDY